MPSREYRLAVIGDPIRHTLSPVMHAAALSAAGLAGTYEAIRVSASDLRSLVALLKAAGFDGFNVTIPHKEAILSCLDDVDAPASALGAVNTVVRREGSFIGSNTDVTGLGRVLDREGPRFGTVVVLGAGGSARAVVAAVHGRCERIVVANRTVERARTLTALAPIDTVYLEAGSLVAVLAEADLLINATSVGLNAPDDSPLPAGLNLDAMTVVVDLVYRPLETALLRQARASGCHVVDGLDMLVAQGADSFALWTGVRPDEHVMRGAALDAVEHAAQPHAINSSEVTCTLFAF